MRATRKGEQSRGGTSQQESVCDQVRKCKIFLITQGAHQGSTPQEEAAAHPPMRRGEMLTLHRVSYPRAAPKSCPAGAGCSRLSLCPAPASEPFQVTVQAGRN